MPCSARWGSFATGSGRAAISSRLFSNTQNPSGQRGDKELELASSERPGDYRRKGVAFSLLGARTNVFILPMTAEEQPAVFAKE